MKRLTKRERKNLKNIPSQKEYELRFARVLLFTIPIFIWITFFTTLYLTLGGYPRFGIIEDLIFFLIINLPSIFLIINYLKKSPINKIKFNSDDKSLTIFFNNNQREIKYEDISLLEGITCKTHFRSLSVFWSQFEYSIIHLKNNEKVYVTCLLMNQLDLLSFKISNKYVWREYIFPMINKN